MEEVRTTWADMTRIIFAGKITGDRKVRGYQKYDSETGDLLYCAVYLTEEEKARFIELGGHIL